MKIDELQPLLLVTTPRNEVLKVSHIYPPTETGTGYATAEVVYPVPNRTSVRSLTPEDVDALRPCSEAMFAKYEQAWDLRKL